MNSDDYTEGSQWSEDSLFDWNWHNTFLKRQGIRPRDQYDNDPDDGWGW